MRPSDRPLRFAIPAALLVFLIAASAIQTPIASEPAAGSAGPAGSARLVVRAEGGVTDLVHVGSGGAETIVRRTAATIASERLVPVLDSGVMFASWLETAGGQAPVRLSSVSRDAGARWSRPQEMDDHIALRAGRIVPGVSAPSLPPELRARGEDRLFLVQFETPGVEAWRRILAGLGAELLVHVPRHAWVVRAEPGLMPRIAGQPFVRWAGRYEPGYRIEPELLAEIAEAACCSDVTRRYNVMAFAAGPEGKAPLAAEIRAIGGRVELEPAGGYRLEATLTLEQVVRLAGSDRLQWIERWTPPETDMDLVREQSGANYVESVAGYSGQGVRAEVMDSGVQFNPLHQDHDGLLVHGPNPSVASHGTNTYGIVFGNGNRDGDGNAQALGLLPSAQGYFYDYDNLTDRYQVTAELVQAPIFASFQTNSWGDARTRAYTSKSHEMDDIIWINDIPIFQSQSNAGNQDSRPQAWAKNVIAVGGINHYNTISLADDCWCSGASIGPAADGRIKPDLAYWYDNIYTTSTPATGYTSTFGGTSAATPMTAGVGGLILQMWADNVLGNNPQGSTVFEKRPHAATTKAMMINTAEQYAFSGTSHDRSRMKQGWGLPSARRFYDRRGLLKVVDESELLQEFDTHTWTADVPAGQGELKITLVYMDRAGTTSSTLHRINDVTLKVTNPAGTTVWWGNNSLDAGNWSSPGGSPDTLNTVENVFIQNPASGSWTIEISADDINQDVHQETPGVDQDYALVVYGVSALTFGCPVPPPNPTGLSATPNGDNHVDLAWTGTGTARSYRIYRSLGGCGGTYAQIGTVPAGQTTFTDTAASGGSDYGYVVRAVEGCESADSNCAPATATGPCLLAPGFAGVGSVTPDNASTCGTTVSWAAATANCGGAVRYNVHRSTSAGFAPGAANRVASCLAGTSWHDTRSLASNQTYHYIVRAEDLGGAGSVVCNGSAEENTVSASALVRGPTATLMNTGFESGLEGWTPAKGSPPATKGDFIAGAPTPTTKNGQPAQPGSCAAGAQCLFTAKNNGGNPDNGDVDGGEVLATSPLFNASGFDTSRLTLSRWHYNSATQSDSGDGFRIDVSNNNGSSWVNLETLGPLASVNAWTPVGFDLHSALALTANMRIRVRSADGAAIDTTVESAIDAVLIEGAQTCSTDAPPAPGGTAAGSLTVGLSGGDLLLSWGADCGGGTGYGIYRGDLAAGYGSLAPLPGHCGIGGTSALIDPDAGSYFYLVAPNDGAIEGSLGRRSDGTPRAQPATRCHPRANPVNACAP